MKLKKYVFKQITLKNKSQMKTKNVLIAAVILISSVLSVSGVFAQDQSVLTGTVKLNIVLKPIQTITVNPTPVEGVTIEGVNLVYDEKSDYENGVSVEQKDHLTVFSTGGFTVSVKSGGDFTNTGGNTNIIEAGDVSVKATAGKGKLNNVVLAKTETTESTLISSDEGGRNLMYDVTYNNEAGASDAYINHYLNGGVEKNTFTTTVTYTIAAK